MVSHCEELNVRNGVDVKSLSPFIFPLRHGVFQSKKFLLKEIVNN